MGNQMHTVNHSKINQYVSIRRLGHKYYFLLAKVKMRQQYDNTLRRHTAREYHQQLVEVVGKNALPYRTVTRGGISITARTRLNKREMSLLQPDRVDGIRYLPHHWQHVVITLGDYFEISQDNMCARHLCLSITNVVL